MMHNAVYLTGMLFVATLSLYHACNIHYLVDRKHSIGDSMCSFMRITILCYACLLLTCLLYIIIPKLLILFYLLTQVWNKHFRKIPSFLLFLVFYMWQYVNTRVILVRTNIILNDLNFKIFRLFVPLKKYKKDMTRVSWIYCKITISGCSWRRDKAFYFSRHKTKRILTVIRKFKILYQYILVEYKYLRA